MTHAKKLILGLVLALSLKNSWSQSSSFVVYKDTVRNYSIKIPVGWRYGKSKAYPDIDLVAIRVGADTSDKAHENFNLNILDKKNSSLEKEYGKLINALSSTGDLNLVKKDDVIINGQDFKWLIETHKVNSLSVTNYVYVGYKNERTYILTLVSLTKDFDKYESVFTEIAHSLTL